MVTPRGVQRKALQGKTRLEQDTAKEVVRLLREAERRIAATLAAQPSDYQRWQLPQLKVEIARQLQVFEREAGERASTAASQAFDFGANVTGDSLVAAGAPEIAAVLPQLDTRQLRAMQSFMVGRMEDISAAVANKINTELGLVVIGVQSPGDAIGKLAKMFKGNRQRAITITRTEVGRAFSIAAQQSLEAAVEKVPGLQKQWRRSGKIHSRPDHDAIDGQVQDVDQPFELPSGETLMFPRDPAGSAKETINCGCESLPYMASWSVANAGRRDFTDAELVPRELQRNPVKAAARARRDAANAQGDTP